jgi:hypothetical protein
MLLLPLTLSKMNLKGPVKIAGVFSFTANFRTVWFKAT